MNSTPDPQPSNAGSGAGAPMGGSGSGFFAWLRGLGVVRGDDRWFAGVAGGIAHRLRIDPLIVRGAFVVLALIGGAAILAYLIGWLLLPDKFGRIHLEEMFRGRAQAGVIIAAVVIAAMLVTPVIFGQGSPFGIANLVLLSPFGLPGWLTATLTWILWIGVIVGLAIWLPRIIKERGSGSAGTPPAGPPSAGDPGAAGAQGGYPGAPRSGGTEAPAAAAHTQSFASAPGAWTAPAAGSPDPGATPTSSGAPTASGAPTVPLDPDAFPAGPGPGAAPGATAGASATGGADGSAESFASRADEWGRRTGEQATEWGKKAGKRAEAWAEDVGRRSEERGARYAAEHEARKAGPVFTLVSLAAALLAAGGAAAFGLASGLPSHDLLLAGLIAGLSTLALALIVAGIRGSRTGWVGFLAACGVVALTVAAILPSGSRFQAFGNVVTNGSEPGVLAVSGNVQLDLSEDTPLSDGSGPHAFTASLVAGNLYVTVPEDRPAVVNVRVLAGVIEDEVTGSGGMHTGGPLLLRTITSGGANAAHPTSDTLLVTVYVAAGRVAVDHAVPGSAPNATTTAQLQLDSENAR
ncbi:PspC domain-containing protein [Leucobacter sp. CSA2]|uniref:PspC domain-containing protein n=1 Tax=Leucobacter edaphi TaxID=2796472 RepID=A0A934QF74_9MICO|nr:PspC domain-containing protein [Leucobacter edaphi]MBK0422382.1 PspC domain-containing protein [Leucobacter edaphi]